MALLVVACVPCPIIVWYAAGAAGRWTGTATLWAIVGCAAALSALSAPVLAAVTVRPWTWKTAMALAFLLLATFWVGFAAY
jgi:hypothetical protein